jgi:hypothetical protein
MFAIGINLLLQLRLPLDKAVSFVKWKAWLDPTYILLAIGVFLYSEHCIIALFS